MDRPKRSNILVKSSQEVLSKMGKRRVVKTDASTRTAVNAWASIQLKESSEGPYFLKTNDWMVQSFKDSVFLGTDIGKSFSEEVLANLNRSLAEFVEHYRTKAGKRLTPASLSTYLEGISRWISENWKTKIDVIRDRTFTDAESGFIHVADRITSSQQSQGVRVQSYNVLSDTDVDTIFNHEVTQVSTPIGYVNRLIMVIGMLLGLRATALRKLKWSMFKFERSFDGRSVIRYEGIIGSIDGESKHSNGGLKAAKSLPKSINIFDFEIKYGINPYNMIMQHKKLCAHTNNQVDFFLRANHNSCERNTFLTSAVIGESHFSRLLNRVFKACKVRGIGPYEHPVLHSLRKTMITNLMRAKCTDSQITLRTGHANIQSLRPYANIMAEAGQIQQSSLLGVPDSVSNENNRMNSGKRSNENDELPESKKKKVEFITRAVMESAAKASGSGNVTVNLNFSF